MKKLQPVHEEANDYRVKPCPLCKSGHVQMGGIVKYRKPTLVAGIPLDLPDPLLVRCKVCSFEYKRPIPRPAVLLSCYEQVATGHWGSGPESGRNTERKKQLLEAWAPGYRILDVGCHDGGFLASLGSRWEIYGVEPSVEAAESAARAGIAILGETIEDACGKEVFDVIVAYDVLEHISDPISFFQAVDDLLSAAGVVIVETGDTASAAFRRQGRFHPYRAIPEHVSFFNQKSLSILGRLVGMKLVHCESTMHNRASITTLLRHCIHNCAYLFCWAIWRLGVPGLPPRIRQIAEGPYPRTIQKKDHLIAVLQKK